MSARANQLANMFNRNGGCVACGFQYADGWIIHACISLETQNEIANQVDSVMETGRSADGFSGCFVCSDADKAEAVMLALQERIGDDHLDHTDHRLSDLNHIEDAVWLAESTS